MQAAMGCSNTHLWLFQARGCTWGVPGPDFGAVLGGFQSQSNSPAFPLMSGASNGIDIRQELSRVLPDQRLACRMTGTNS